MAATPIKPTDIELDPKYDNFDYPIVAKTKEDGHLGYLDPQQAAKVYQLRMMLEAQGYTKRLDTITLLRFLRARKFDVQLSMKMFVECEQWRKDTDLDNVVRTWTYPEKKDMFKYYPQYYHKTDKDGRPVYIEQLGEIDLPTMKTITTMDRMVMNLAVEYERMADPRLPASCRKSGQLLETCCTIMDMKGVGISKASQVYSYIREVSGLSQNYYPERLGRFYLINAPWGFSGVWAMIKGWLDPVTVAKIHILGSSYQKELFSQVAPENLPKRFGGTCECPNGCEFSDAGPWQEEEWYRPAWWEKPAPSDEKTEEKPDLTTDKDTPNVTLEAPGAAAETGAEAGVKATA